MRSSALSGSSSMGAFGDCAGDGIEQAFQHANSRRHLAGSQLLDQFVGVLLVCRHDRDILHRDV
ncbi:MAG: hypothetical protein ABSC33_21055 [Candidatus Sulfotelmatobacter sp.]